jgi:hypothetical protein
VGGEGLRLEKAHTAYPTPVPPPKALLRVALGSLSAGERRVVRLTLAVPALPAAAAAAAAAGAAGGAAQHHLLTATAAYTCVATGGARAAPPAQVVVARAVGRAAAARAAASAVSVEVDAARARDEATDALAAALALAGSGRHGEAREALAAHVRALQRCAAAAHPLVEGLRADLEAMAEACKSQAAFAARGGSATMRQAIAGHRRQQFAHGARAARSQIAYQLPQQRSAMAAQRAVQQSARGGGSGGGGGGGSGGSGGSGKKRSRI